MDNERVNDYVGKQYTSCAAMAVDLMKNEFDKEIPIVAEEVNFDNRMEVIKKLNVKQIQESELQEGDIVLMGSKGTNSHIGVMVNVRNALHCLHHLNVAAVCCHRLVFLKQLAIKIDGYYRVI